jgi:hypothetical protein
MPSLTRRRDLGMKRPIADRRTDSRKLNLLQPSLRPASGRSLTVTADLGAKRERAEASVSMPCFQRLMYNCSNGLILDFRSSGFLGIGRILPFEPMESHLEDTRDPGRNGCRLDAPVDSVWPIGLPPSLWLEKSYGESRIGRRIRLETPLPSLSWLRADGCKHARF